MNFIQKIRAAHLNRHGFVDTLGGVVLFQIVYITLLFKWRIADIDPSDFSDITPPAIGFILVTGLIIAPLVENMLLIGIAALHEKLFNRTCLFIVAPLLLTSLHFFNAHHMQYPIFFRVLSLFLFFYVFLKQYDVHKLEMGKFKALLLSSAIHFAINASGMLIVFLLELNIDAETIFSAQQGE